MGSFNDYLELKVLDHLFGDTAYTAPGDLYVGLSTTPISEDGTGISEPVGGNYARVEVTNNTTNWPNATQVAGLGTKQNGAAVTFAQASASWGQIVDFFMADAATSGNILCYGSLDIAKTIDEDDTAEFPIGGITITLD
jgi:hypothetical protein